MKTKLGHEAEGFLIVKRPKQVIKLTNSMNISDSQNQSQFDKHHYIGKLLTWHIQWRKKGKEEELPKLGHMKILVNHYIFIDLYRTVHCCFHLLKYTL